MTRVFCSLQFSENSSLHMSIPCASVLIADFFLQRLHVNRLKREKDVFYSHIFFLLSCVDIHLISCELNKKQCELIAGWIQSMAHSSFFIYSLFHRIVSGACSNGHSLWTPNFSYLPHTWFIVNNTKTCPIDKWTEAAPIALAYGSVDILFIP